LMRFVFGALVLLLLIFSAPAMEASRQAALVFVQSVMPSLFPMMVLCHLVEKLPAKKGSRHVEMMETIAFCLLSGSPASAKRVHAFVQNDEHFTRNALPMMGFCGVMSPLFFLGALQSHLPKGVGLMLLICHWLGAALTGAAAMLLCCRAKNPPRLRDASSLTKDVSTDLPARPETLPLLRSLPGAIAAAMQGLLAVLGSMMLMGIVCAILRRLLCLALPAGWQSPGFFAVIHGLMEVGGGCLALLEATALPDLPLLCGLCGFGGLSIWMQCLLFLGQEIRPGKLLLLRLFHGAVSYGICFLLLLILPKGITAFSPAGVQVPFRDRWTASLLPAAALLLPLLPGLVRSFSGKPRTCSPHS